MLKAYAKLNLCLNIEGKREDGYHNIDTVMLPVSLYDTLRVAKNDTITVFTDGSNIPNNELNIAYVAAKAFFESARIKSGAKIAITKRIPAEAGLGGGSSDAATVLVALNKIYDTRLTNDSLKEIAVKVGADVPFFLTDGCKRARGIGEILTPVQYDMNVYYLIVKCRGGVSTAKAYAMLAQMDSAPCDVDEVISYIGKNNIRGYINTATNMLHKSAVYIQPNIETALRALDENGCLFSMVTGSGSAVFGVYQSIRAALLAEYKLKDNESFEFVKLVHNTDRTIDEVLGIF